MPGQAVAPGREGRPALSMRRSVLGGLFWVSLGSYVGKVLQYMVVILLARILAPSDFGLIAIASMIVGSIGMVKDLGMGAALIYEQEDIARASDTAFWLLAAMGVFLYAACFFLAPPVAAFFGYPSLVAIIRVQALVIVVACFTVVPGTLLEKELKFKRNVLPGIVGSISYVCVTMLLAFRGFGVWALVYGGLLSSLLAGIALWLVAPFRPSLRFSWGVGKRLFGYGNFAMLDNLLIFAGFKFLDSGVIGKVLGAIVLGWYDIAYRMATLPSTNVTLLVGKVTFPVYSKFQTELARLKELYLRTVRYLAAVVLPAAGVLLLAGPIFIRLFYGSAWLPAIPLLQVLTFYGLVIGIAAPAGQILYSLGKPKVSFLLNLLKFVVTLALAYPVARWFGALGVSIWITLVHALVSVVLLARSHSLLRVGPGEYFRGLKCPLVASCLSGLLGMWLAGMRVAFFSESFAGLTLLVALYLGSCAALLLALDGELRRELASLVPREELYSYWAAARWNQ